MSGGLACAMVAPSAKVTIEWTIDCGCTTTSMSAYGTSKSRCASISSRPLLTRVAELIVTTGPMSQVGWASASSTVTSASSSARAAAERSAAGGEHQPGHLAAGAAAQALGQRRVLGVDRHELPRRRGRGDQLAAGDQRLLVGQRDGAPGRERRRASGRSPIEPVIPLRTTSAGRAASSSAARGPARISGSEYSPLAQPRLRGGGVEGQLEVLRGGGPGDGDGADAEGQRLLGEQGDVPSPGGQAGDPQPVGVLLGDRDRLPADGAGRPEHGDLAGLNHSCILPDGRGSPRRPPSCGARARDCQNVAP